MVFPYSFAALGGFANADMGPTAGTPTDAFVKSCLMAPTFVAVALFSAARLTLCEMGVTWFNEIPNELALITVTFLP